METLKNVRQIMRYIILGTLGLSVLFFLMALAEDDMLIGLIFTGSILAICVDFIIAYDFYEAAMHKGYEDTKYFWYSFILGVVGYLLVIALPDKTVSSRSYDDELPEL